MGILKGAVTSAKGKPIAEARVMIIAGAVHPDIAGLTNDDGHFRMTGLTPGKYRIEVDAEGFSAARGGVRVLTQGARLYRIKLEPIDYDVETDGSVPEID
ncbi:MAG: carboxypeptidase-like regulatory domain-containing protein [Alphaproteobacteria bacterium]|nr:carboxypeptidase-like regulatory domain-containing protein [Alphaproteobacteria bacterium]